MKNSVARWSVVMGAFLACAVSSSFGSYVYDNFEAYSGAINGNGWGGSASVTAQTAVVHWGAKAAELPVSSVLSNSVNAGAGATNVWSDFWTVPRFYVSDTGGGPAADTNATAQFYIASNGLWTVISREGGVIVTQAISTNVYGASIGARSEVTNFIHVSVYHNYSSKKWSLFVEGTPIATNLGFINSSATSYNWFNVQNGGGDKA